jgi:hypothetical protein
MLTAESRMPEFSLKLAIKGFLTHRERLIAKG